MGRIESLGEFWSVLIDRSQGAAKLKPDEIEIMVHRRLFYDDHFGVGEPLDEHAFDEPLVARGKHYIYRGMEDNPEWRRQRSQELYLGPIAMFQATDKSADEWLASAGNKTKTVLKANLPPSINLMTIENWDSPGTEESELEILVRFENIYEASEGGQTETLEIPDEIFDGLVITDMIEMSLGGDRPISDVTNRFQWGKNAQKV